MESTTAEGELSTTQDFNPRFAFLARIVKVLCSPTEADVVQNTAYCLEGWRRRFDSLLIVLVNLGVGRLESRTASWWT